MSSSNPRTSWVRKGVEVVGDLFAYVFDQTGLTVVLILLSVIFLFVGDLQTYLITTPLIMLIAAVFNQYEKKISNLNITVEELRSSEQTQCGDTNTPECVHPVIPECYHKKVEDL